MKTIQLILVALLLAGAMSKITPRAPMKKHSLLKGDFLYKDLNEYFDLDEVTYPLMVSGNNAIANNQTDSYMHKHFQIYNFQKLDWVQQVNQDTLVFCYDNKNIVIQVMRGEGKAFGYHHKFSFPQADIVCHDTAHYEHRSFLYVGCVTRSPKPPAVGAVYILTWDYVAQKITHTEITNQDDGFVIRNRLGMFISEKSGSTGSPTPYLVVYDTGNTNAMTHRGNDMIRVYRNIQLGKLKFYKVLKVDDHEYDIVYNMFPYHQSIIISGRVNGPTSTIVTLAQCSLNFTKDVVTCSDKLKATTVTEGMVGLDFTQNQYYEINTQTKTINIAELSGDFHSTNWNRNVLHTMSDLDLMHSESAYVRLYTGNGILGTINYGSIGGGGDHGYTGISFESKLSWSVEGAVAANIGSSIVWGRSH